MRLTVLQKLYLTTLILYIAAIALIVGVCSVVFWLAYRVLL